MGSDGMEKPVHGPRISTSKGRGRRSNSVAPSVRFATRMPTPSHTNRCRHRRKTISTAMLTNQMAFTAGAVARTPATSATRVSAGVRMSLIACSTRASATSTAVTLPVTSTTTQSSTTRALSASHHRPEVLRLRGRGGGSPDGRRRLRTRWIAAGAGRGTGIGCRVPGSACGRDAMPPMLHRSAGPDHALGPGSEIGSIRVRIRLRCAASGLRCARHVPEGEEVAVRRPRVGQVAVLLLVALLPACTGEPGAPSGGTDSAAAALRMASYDFSESQSLVEVYAEAARRAGVPVTVEHGIGTRGIVLPAVEQGLVDAVIGYTGTALG